MLSVFATLRSSFRGQLSTLLSVGALLWGCGGTADGGGTDVGGEDLGQNPTPASSEAVFSRRVGEDRGKWCDSEVDPPLVGRVRATSRALAGVSIYQGVEISLREDEPPRTDLVAGRDALVRVFVAPGERADGARLIVDDGQGQEAVQEEDRRLLGPSKKGDLDSSYNFIIPGDVLNPGSALQVELFDVQECAAAAPSSEPAVFPKNGRYGLRAREVGSLQVVLVPIRYDADGSSRLPDVSEAHVRELRDHLYALYPVKDVILSVHEAVGTQENSMEGVLGQLLHLRSLEQPASNVSYFGLVNPAPTMAEYCNGSCVAGVSAVGSPSGDASAGVGIGFRGPAQETFLHELGHMNRLEHSPCGDPSSPDGAFPHEDAQLGTWGFDVRDFRLLDPKATPRDFMSYCDPTWISDYNYQKLIDRLSLVNAMPRADIVNFPGNDLLNVDERVGSGAPFAGEIVTCMAPGSASR